MFAILADKFLLQMQLNVLQGLESSPADKLLLQKKSCPLSLEISRRNSSGGGARTRRTFCPTFPNPANSAAGWSFASRYRFRCCWLSWLWSVFNNSVSISKPWYLSVCHSFLTFCTSVGILFFASVAINQSCVHTHNLLTPPALCLELFLSLFTHTRRHSTTWPMARQDTSSVHLYQIQRRIPCHEGVYKPHYATVEETLNHYSCSF